MNDICAIGNALVDIIVPVDDAFLTANSIVKGAMALVDENAASDLFSRVGPAVELSSGGSAGNTLAGAASLGSSCSFLGKVGKDSFGEVFTHDLHANGIVFSTPASITTQTGRCIILVTPDAQRTMNTFLGAAVEFGPEDVDAGLVQNAAVTYLEGYLFDKPFAQKAFGKAARLAHEAGRKTSMTLSDVFCVSRHRDAFLNLIKGDIDILFGNEHELKALYETNDIDAALSAARGSAEIVVATLGANGSCILAGDETFAVPAHPVPAVIDTTGAGDLFAAGFLHGLTHGRNLADCAKIGAIAAGEVISHYGPRPQKKLKDLVQSI